MIEASPIVSIIIPCFNQSQYLDEAVDSVLMQSYQDFEIIVVNDGSNEPQTVEIINNYDRQKTTVIHTDNQGLPSARNNGIRLARGKYILPLDADDKIGSTYIEEAVELLEQNDNLGIVYCEAVFFGSQEGKWELPEYKFPNILLGNVIFCSGFFRKSDWEKVGGYNPNMIYGWEDYDFWLSIIGLGREVHCIPKTLFFYRCKPVSMSKSIDKEKLVKCYTQMFDNHKDIYAQNISTIFREIVYLREDVEQARGRIKQLEKHEEELENELRKTQGDWKSLKDDWDVLQENLRNAQTKIREMEKWQIVLLFKIKKLISEFIADVSKEGWNIAIQGMGKRVYGKLAGTFNRLLGKDYSHTG